MSEGGIRLTEKEMKYIQTFETVTGATVVDCVEEKFFDILNYSICYTVNKYLGKEEAVKFFREMGRIHYQELKRQGVIVVEKEPLKTLENIARYLEKSGYMKKIDVKKIGEDEALVDMYGVSVLDSSIRLVEEGRSPSHIMTNTMFAALEDLGYEAEIIDLLFDKKTNHVREEWIIKQRYTEKGS